MKGCEAFARHSTPHPRGLPACLLPINVIDSTGGDDAYDLTPDGTKGCETLGIDVVDTRIMRRRFAYACLDWSERRPHIGGALGAALLKVALKRKWVVQDFDTRALDVTSLGRREMLARFGLHF